MVTVDVFTLGYNEERILPHFIDHYRRFCRNITFYNNMSTDSSVKICLDNGVNVINTGIDELNDIENLKIKQSCYFNSDADFVIVVDNDELVYHPDIINLLEGYKEQGINLPKIRGYTMATTAGYPEVGKLVQTVTKGVPSINYAKRCIFSPKLGINWSAGCHKIVSVRGEYKESDQQDLSLLHYKFIDKKEIHDKKMSYSKRMSNINKMYLLGAYYNVYDYEETEKWFDDHVKQSIKVI